MTSNLEVFVDRMTSPAKEHQVSAASKSTMLITTVPGNLRPGRWSSTSAAGAASTGPESWDDRDQVETTTKRRTTYDHNSTHSVV